MSDIVALLPVLGLLLSTVSLFVIARVLPQRFWLAIFISVAIGFIGCSAIAGSGLSSGDWLYFLAGYFSLSFCFFHFNNLGETSIRFRIIGECLRRKGCIDVQELKKEYDSTDIVEFRLKRLLTTQKVLEKNGRYVPNSFGLKMIVTLIYFIKKLLFKN